MKLEIYIKPIGKARARVTKHGAYTPQKTKDFERVIAWEFKKAYPSAEISNRPIKLSVMAIFQPPKSYSKKKRESALTGDLRYVKKPDSDNLAKAIMDSLNGVAWKDDNQVFSLEVTKMYGLKDKLIIDINEIM